MQEETKEEYITRLRREQGKEDPLETAEDDLEEVKSIPLKARLKSFFFLFLFALFMYAIYMIFGMLKSN